MLAAALRARAVTWGAVGELLPGCAGRENTGTTGKVAPLWLAGQKRLSRACARRVCSVCIRERAAAGGRASRSLDGDPLHHARSWCWFLAPFPHKATLGCSLKHFWAPLTLPWRRFHPAQPQRGLARPPEPNRPKTGLEQRPEPSLLGFPTVLLPWGKQPRPFMLPADEGEDEVTRWQRR